MSSVHPHVTGVTHRPYSLVAHVLVITKNTNLMAQRALKPIVAGILLGNVVTKL